MHRQYYLLKITDTDITHSLDICIGQNDTQRYSLDKKFLLIKTTAYLIECKIKEDVAMEEIFPADRATKITFKEAQALMKTPEWAEVLNLE